MAVEAYFFPTCTLSANQKQLNLVSDTIEVLLVASGSYTWNATAATAATVHDFLTANGALTEVSTSGTNYSRLTLAGTALSLTDSFSSPNAYSSLTYSNTIQWTSATFSASYAAFFDNTKGTTDTTNQLICYWDFGGSQSVTSSTFTLQLGSLNGVSNCIVQWQSYRNP